MIKHKFEEGTGTLSLTPENEKDKRILDAICVGFLILQEETPEGTYKNSEGRVICTKLGGPSPRDREA